MMRFIVTYYDANKEKRIRFFKTLVGTNRSVGSGCFSNFEIKIVKPY